MRDPDLRRCTHAEVGVWFRILCLMYESEFKGMLATKGVPWTDDEIACAVGGNQAEAKKCVAGLVTKGVASRTEEGALINRRMYREHSERLATRKRVHDFRERQKVNSNCNGEEAPNVTHCTETEYEEHSLFQEELNKETTTRENLSTEEQEERIYDAYPRKASRGTALKAIRAAVGKLVIGSVKKPPMNAREARRWLWERAAEYAASPAGQKAPGKEEWRPYAATWFNGERYFDDDSEWQQGGGKRGASGGNNQGAAAARVKRTGSAWDTAIEQRLAGPTGNDAAPDVGSISPSGIRQRDDEGLSADLRGPSDGVRHEKPRDGPPLVPDAPEILSPPQRGPRGT